MAIFNTILVLLIGMILLISTCHGQRELKYNIKEEQSPDETVVNLVKDTDIRTTVPLSDVSSLTFTIDSVRPSTAESMFYLDTSNGILGTLGTVDREIVCPRLESCVITLDVSVNPIQYFRIFTILLTIIDKNDNEPTFRERVITKYISEATQPSSSASFTLPLAEDPDSPQFSVTSYVIEPPSTVFSLLESKVDGEITGLSLVLNEMIDREITDFYQFRVIAMNGGVRPSSNAGILTVNVEVLDINDNKPKFENLTYQISLFEDITVGVVILTIHAEDPDLGNNGKISYELDKSRSSGGLFAVNSTSGELYVLSELNRERSHRHRLYVTATDNGPEALTDQAVVYVTVLDVNDNEPFIKVHGLSGVSEVAKVGTPVAHISVSDPDTGTNAKFSCSSDSSLFNLEPVTAGEYRLKTARTLEADELEVVTVVVQCQDSGQPIKIATRALDISILDSNDNSPVFERGIYNVKMEENRRSNLFVIQVKATDLDRGLNAKVHYTITGGDINIFDIDQSSGVITTRRPLDYETKDRLQVVVSAIDGGNPKNSATATLVVQVTNVDDESPKFVQTHYTFRALLKDPPGTVIGEVSAKDADGPPYDKFTYSMSYNHDLFHVDPYEGLLLLTKNLPQHPAKYHLQIYAKSEGLPMKIGRTNVTVSVTETRNSTGLTALHTSQENQNMMIIIGIACGSAVCVVVLVAGITMVLYRSRRVTGKKPTAGMSSRETRYSISVEHNKEALDDSDEVFISSAPQGGVILAEREKLSSTSYEHTTSSGDSGKGRSDSEDVTSTRMNQNNKKITSKQTNSQTKVQNNLNKDVKLSNKNLKLAANMHHKNSEMPSNAGTLPMAPARQLYQGISRTKIYYIKGEGVPPEAPVVSTPKLNTSRNNLSGSYNNVSSWEYGRNDTEFHGGLNAYNLNKANTSIMKRNISWSEQSLPSAGNNNFGYNESDVSPDHEDKPEKTRYTYDIHQRAPNSAVIV